MTLVEVTFKGNRREFFSWEFADVPTKMTHVIVDADRGEDLGTIYSTGELAEKRRAGTAHGIAQTDALRPALRLASDDEISKGAHLREDEDNVRKRAIEKVRAQGLEMKVSDTEWQWDRKKLTIYFTAEKRVDFRQLVRQLEGLFGTRVQMWHIGVRDEAKRLDGIGRCARQYCSASWLPELRPVKSSIAKDQRLSTLNPAQISGSCGRLMCCLRYEHEFYVQQRKRFPKEGKIITTTAGEEKIVSNDIFREQVTLRGATGETRIVPLAQLNRELGGEPVTAASDLPSHDDEPDFEEEITGESYLVDPPANRRAPLPSQQPSQQPAPESAPRSRERQQSRQQPPREQQARAPQREQQPRQPQREQQPRQPQRDQQPRQPQRQQQARPQSPQAPKPSQPARPEQQQQQQSARSQPQPGQNQPPQQSQPQDGSAEGGRRRRRRGRRGGRRGREGGAGGEGGGAPPAPSEPTAS